MVFKTNFKISNYFGHVFSSSAPHLEEWGAGGAGSERASLPPLLEQRMRAVAWVPPAGTGDQFCPRGREAGCASSCRNPPASAAARPRRGREERQGCEQELARQELSPSRRPVCGRWLCRPHPALVLSPPCTRNV